MEKEKTFMGFYSQTEFIAYAMTGLFQRPNRKFPPCNRVVGKPADGWAVIKDRGLIRAIKLSCLPYSRFWFDTNSRPDIQAPEEVIIYAKMLKKIWLLYTNGRYIELLHWMIEHNENNPFRITNSKSRWVK